MSAKVLPKICNGDLCENRDYCPFYKNNVAPVGEYCPIEALLIAKLKYALTKDLEVSPGNTSEEILLNDLIELQLYDIWRLNGPILMKNILLKQPVSIDPKSKTIMYADVVNPLLEVKMKFQEKKAKILNEFLATRKSKFMTKRGELIDPSVAMAKILSRAESSEKEKIISEDKFKEIALEAEKERQENLKRLDMEITEDKSLKQDISEEDKQLFLSFFSANFEVDNAESYEILQLIQGDAVLMKFFEDLVVYMHEHSVTSISSATKRKDKMFSVKLYKIPKKQLEIGVFYDSYSKSQIEIQEKILNFLLSNSDVVNKYNISLMARPLSTKVEENIP